MTPSGQVPATEVVKEDPGPSLSVLITYHDEGKMLTECIDSLLAGAIRPSEIVVYDDHSSREANSFVPQGFPVRVVRRSEEHTSELQSH